MYRDAFTIFVITGSRTSNESQTTLLGNGSNTHDFLAEALMSSHIFRSPRLPKLFSTHNYFSYEQSFLLACFVFKMKSIENSMEGQRSFRGFRSRNGSKLPNLSPERATKEYKYGTSGPRRRCREPGKGFGKKTARATFSSTPNIRKLIFWVG